MKIDINRDLDEIQETLWKDFGAKQIIYMLIGGGFGTIAFLLSYKTLSMLISSYISFIVAAPIIYIGFYNKNGMNAKEAVQRVFTQVFFPKTLLFASTEAEVIKKENGSQSKNKNKTFFPNPSGGRKPSKKKSGVFVNKLKKYQEADEPRFKVPKSVQQANDIVGIAKNGIFELPNGNFSKSYLFFDINYETEADDNKLDILEGYCSFLSSMDVPFKITIENATRDNKLQENNVFMPNKEDGFDSFREIYNNIRHERLVEGKQGLEQKRYLTVVISRKNYEDAKDYFTILENAIKNSFEEMGSILIPLDAKERLHILYKFTHLGDETSFDFDFDVWVKQKRDVINDISNSKLRFMMDHIIDENKYSRILYVQRFPRSLSDRFLNELASLSIHSTITLDINPVTKDDTISILDNKYLGVENTIRKQQKTRNKNNDFSSDISYKKMQDKSDVQEMLNDVKENDQTLFLVAVTMLISAKSKEELDRITESVQLVGKGNGCRIEPSNLKQKEALNTVLPIGVRQINTMRTMLTQSLAALHPFNVQELFVAGVNAVFYGINQVSKNLIIGNRKKLVNPGGWIFGVPGSGKSMFAKLEIGEVFLNTEDDIIVIDPQNEFFDIAETYNGTIIEFSSTSETYVNPLDLNKNREDIKNMIAEKAEYMQSHCEKCKGEPLNGREKSIIDRCVKELYKNWKPSDEQRLMKDFSDLLLKQPEIEAEDLALYLEKFIDGTLDMFAHQTNVDVNNRFTCYGLKELGATLAPLGMLVMMSNISNRVYENFKKGIATWIYMDEAHVLLKDPATAAYLVTSWKVWRKFGGIPTGITQNSIDLIRSPESETLIGNSEFIALLKQAPLDCRHIANSLGISEAKIKYVKNAEPGKGVLKHGSSMIPFDCTIDKENDLYKLYNTNFHEKHEVKEVI